jgi:hypothetical protein
MLIVGNSYADNWDSMQALGSTTGGEVPTGTSNATTYSPDGLYMSVATDITTS